MFVDVFVYNNARSSGIAHLPLLPTFTPNPLTSFFFTSLFLFCCRRAILGNPDVLGTGSWSQMLHNDFWGTPLVDSGSHGSYRPLCVASFKLNYLLDGFKPFGYHLVNVLLHSLATGLVVKLARHLLPAGRTGVAIAGLLFAAHPIHTEAVAGVVGRADLTGCIFYLLALLAYIRHVRWRQWGDRRQWLALAATVLLAAAALLCKETAVTALVVCAIYDIIKGYAGSRDKVRSCPHFPTSRFSARSPPPACLLAGAECALSREYTFNFKYALFIPRAAQHVHCATVQLPLECHQGL